ncbi:hypothetical protein K1719_015895 [Acacia pycnantha]|nr:hypothetical protein K1719_015895 [Acacia pycnantha]
MANSKLACVVVFLLALMFSHAILCAVGRPLKPQEKNEHVTTYENNVKEMAAVASEPGTNDNDGLQTWADDFRPTDPGHSPGAGHGHPSPRT